MAKVILQLRKSTDTHGYLFVRHIHGGKRILNSLETKMSFADFDEYFEKKHQCFKPTSTIDFRRLNGLIEANLQANPFADLNPARLLTFWSSQLITMSNPFSRGDYEQNLVKMTKYLTSINQPDITMHDINIHFVKMYKKWLVEVVKNKPNTVSHHLTILRAVLNMASNSNTINYTLDSVIFKKLISTNVPSKKDLPAMGDVHKLMALPPDSLHYTEVNMFLLAISLGGIRFCDLLFLKYGDFKSTHVRFISSKTGKQISVPFTNQIFTILGKLFGIPTLVIKKTVSDYIKDLSKEKTEPTINYNVTEQHAQIKKNVLKHMKSKSDDEFLFHNIMASDLFNDYEKTTPMTDPQKNTYGIRRTRYNETLTKICSVHKLSIVKMTSHFSRYVAVMILLENGMDFIKISKILQHAKVQQTIDYIKNNYDDEYFTEMGGMMNKSF